MLAENIYNINKSNIILCDPIKNSIMQYSNFYKLLYSNNYLSLNGIFAVFNLYNIQQNKDKIIFDNNSNNINYITIQEIIHLELYLLNLVNHLNKNATYKISEFISNGCFKYCYGDKNNINNINKLYTDDVDYNFTQFILKISGIWETKENIGLTFKIILLEDCIDFCNN